MVNIKMALFGIIKKVGETVRTEVSGWMEQDYFIDAVGSSFALFFEEMINRMLLTTTGVAGTKATALKQAIRLFFSYIFYTLGKRLGKPTLGLIASIIPIALVFIDLASYVIGATPEQAGLSLSQKLGGWRATARASAGASQPVKVSSPPTQQPAVATASVF